MASAFQSVDDHRREVLFECMTHQEELPLFYSKMSLPRASLEEDVLQDYRSTGLSVKAHPVKFLREKVLNGPLPDWKRKWAHYHSDVLRKTSQHKQPSRILGLTIVLQRPPTAKGTAFATLEDEYGFIDLIFHRKIFERYKETIRDDQFFWVMGEVQREGHAVQVIVKGVERITSTQMNVEHVQPRFFR